MAGGKKPVWTISANHKETKDRLDIVAAWQSEKLPNCRNLTLNAKNFMILLKNTDEYFISMFDNTGAPVAKKVQPSGEDGFPSFEQISGGEDMPF